MSSVGRLPVTTLVSGDPLVCVCFSVSWVLYHVCRLSLALDVEPSEWPEIKALATYEWVQK
jgi:hypothetical protein